MFYTYIARVLAGLALFFGALNLVGGLAIESDWFGPHAEIMARYWPHSTTGKMMDQGFLAIVAGVALDSLAEISLSVRKLAIGTVEGRELGEASTARGGKASVVT